MDNLFNIVTQQDELQNYLNLRLYCEFGVEMLELENVLWIEKFEMNEKLKESR